MNIFGFTVLRTERLESLLRQEREDGQKDMSDEFWRSTKGE